MNSRNHIMFGSVGEWFYTHLAGIRQTKGTVGYSSLEIRPPPVDILVNSPLNAVAAAVNTPYGEVGMRWVRIGGSICGTFPENSWLELSCQTGLIQSVSFASFGTPSGACGSYSTNSSCDAKNSTAIVQKACVGKNACSLYVTNKLFGDPCFNTYKHLSVQLVCDKEPEYFLEVAIPVNVPSTIVEVSKLALSNVTISSGTSVVWQSDTFFPLPGITSAIDTGNSVVFSVGSGTFQFMTTGIPGSLLCYSAQETEDLAIECPNNQTISMVKFASYGTPSVDCSSDPVLGTCHAGSSKYVVQQNCLNQSSCVVPVNNDLFGDPCYGTKKWINVRYICS